MSNSNSFVEYRDRFSDMHACTAWHTSLHICASKSLSVCTEFTYLLPTWKFTTVYIDSQLISSRKVSRQRSLSVRKFSNSTFVWIPFLVFGYIILLTLIRSQPIALHCQCQFCDIHTHDYHWYIFLFILWLLPLNRIETPFFSRNSMRIRWMSWLNIVRQCSSFIIRAVCMIFIIFRFFACAFACIFFRLCICLRTRLYSLFAHMWKLLGFAGI